MPKAMVLLLLLALVGVAQSTETFNVLSFGARGDGVKDDKEAFQAAWDVACRTLDATLLVPRGYTFLLSPVSFTGPCHPGMNFQLEGTIVAPPTPANWPKEFEDTWIQFYRLVEFNLQGGGVFDGSGQAWWEISCNQKKPPPNCKSILPTAVRFEGGLGILVYDITVRNSQNKNLIIGNVERVRVTSFRVQNPEDSPNTDGIYLGGSSVVAIDYSTFQTGDDCIAIGTGSRNVLVENVQCGPGHGISIGSLGKDNSYANVSNVVVRNNNLTGTTNGVRIKTWPGGKGTASGMRFQNLTMNHVANPVIIDQFYCGKGRPCAGQDSNVQISDVSFENIVGTSSTLVGMTLNCSKSNPCTNINSNNINLVFSNGVQALAYCHNAAGLSETCG